MVTYPRPIFLSLLIGLLCLIGTGCSPEGKKQKIIETAGRHYEAGNYDSAEVEYLNLLKVDPQSGHAISRLGLIYTAQGRTNRAVAFIMRAHEMLPNDLDVRIKVGQLYFASGKPTEARAEANFVLDRNPQDVEAPVLLVATIQSPEDAESIRRRLLQLPAPAPSRAPVLAALASLELRLGRLTEAETLLAQARAADASFAGQYSVQAAVALARKNLPAAEQAFKQAATLSAPRSPRILQYAQFKVRSGDLAAGTKLLEEITVKTPDYMPAWLALADINLGQGKLDECANYLGRVLNRDTQNLEAMILQARLENLRNQPEKALEFLEKLVGPYPRVPAIHLEMGRAYANLGDLTKATASLNQALSLAPNQPDAVLLLARLHSRKGDHNAAIALLRKTIELRPDMPQARMVLADAYRSQGNLPEALAIYRALEQQSPDNAQVIMLIGMVLFQQGKNDEAKLSFEKAFQMTPDSPVALEQLVNIALREKKYAAITARIEAEIAKNAKLAGYGQLLLAKVHLAQENRTAAEANLKKAVELLPESPTAYFLLAGIYTRTNRQEEALTQLTEVLTRDPKQVTALMLASVIQDQRGNFEAARDGYEKLLAVNPRSVVALNNLAYLQSEKFSNPDKAYELAQKARQLSPGDPHSADTLGWILHRRRQYARARSLLEEAVEKLPDQAEIHFHLGLTSYMIGDENASRVSLDRAVQLDSTAAWNATARQALALLALSPDSIGAEAKTLIEKALAERPDDPVALIRQSALLEREGKVAQAVAALETALKTNDQSAPLLVRLARLESQGKNAAKALEYAKAARKLAPDDPQVARSLGRLAYENGDFAWAASLLQEAARRQTDSPDLLYELALANYSIGRTTDAAEALRNALNLASKQPLVVFAAVEPARNLQNLLTLADNPPQALEQLPTLERTLQSEPTSVPTLMAIGAAQEQRHAPDQAKQNYEKALARFPDFSPAKLRLVALAGSSRTFDQRIHDWALQLRPIYPNDPLVAKTLGIQTLFKGDHVRAAALLRETVNARKADAEAMYFLGIAQNRAKDAAFKQTLQQAIDSGLSDPTLLGEARKVLAESK